MLVITFIIYLTDDSLLLGKGEFGLVYRGKVEGYDKELAIKKNTANISATSFKNMLSEIKIMIYVGKHPNIVSIVGAHTGDIRQGIQINSYNYVSSFLSI